MKQEPTFTIVGDEPLEARIVAWVLGESSAFEAAELERICSERAELRVFQQRLSDLHGLLREAETAGPDEQWRLPQEKRHALELLAASPASSAPPTSDFHEFSSQRSARRALWAIAICLTVTSIVTALLAPGWGRKSATTLNEDGIVIEPAAKTAEPHAKLLEGAAVLRDAPGNNGLTGAERDHSAGTYSTGPVAMNEAKNKETSRSANTCKSMRSAPPQAPQEGRDEKKSAAPADLAAMNAAPRLAAQSMEITPKTDSITAMNHAKGKPRSEPAPAGLARTALTAASPAPEKVQCADGQLTAASPAPAGLAAAPAAETAMPHVATTAGALRQKVSSAMAKGHSYESESESFDEDRSLKEEAADGNNDRFAINKRDQDESAASLGGREALKRSLKPSLELPWRMLDLTVGDKSYRMAQEAIAQGRKPNPAEIRIEEFYNGLDYGDPAPRPGEAFAVYGELCSHPWLTKRSLLRVAITPAADNQPVRMGVRFNSQRVLDSRLLGFDPRSGKTPSAHPRAISPAAGQPAPQSSTVAIYELELKPGENGVVIGVLRVELRDPASGVISFRDSPVAGESSPTTSPSMQVAALAVAVAEKLRGSAVPAAALEALTESVKKHDVKSPRVTELLRMVEPLP